jgi:RNA polymerase sigma-70 factor (ECF subfamily)
VGEKDLDERRRKEELLARLYDEYYDRIARYISIRIGNQAEAEDLAGEVFLKALESLDSYQERGAPMQAWLFKIAHNLLVDYVRKVSKQKTIPVDKLEISDGVNMEETVERQLQSEKLSQALKGLTPAQREVIGLRFFAGLTSNEVGKILGKSSGAVREMQSAAVKSLRKLMYEGS